MAKRLKCNKKNIKKCFGELSLGELKKIKKDLDKEIKWAIEEKELLRKR